MSLQSERLQLLMQRLSLTEMVHGYEALAEQAAQKNLPYCDFLEQVLESEANVRQERNIKVRTQLAGFPDTKRLEQFDFKLVHEARRERRRLMKLAPHLARPLPFLLPIYRGDPYSPLKIRLGLTIYDLLGNLGGADRHRMLDAESALELVPGLLPEGLRAAAVCHDSSTDDARLTLENVIDGAERGAVVLNYSEIRALALSGEEVVAAEVEDGLTGRRHEVSGRFWVNATGPWVDRVRAMLPGFDGSRTVRLTKGTHVLIPPVTGRHALLGAVLPDRRVFLIVPWHNCALLGTTDTDFEGDPARVGPERAETECFRGRLRRRTWQEVGRGSALSRSSPASQAPILPPTRATTVSTRTLGRRTSFRFAEGS